MKEKLILFFLILGLSCGVIMSDDQKNVSSEDDESIVILLPKVLTKNR